MNKLIFCIGEPKELFLVKPICKWCNKKKIEYIVFYDFYYKFDIDLSHDKHFIKFNDRNQINFNADYLITFNPYLFRYNKFRQYIRTIKAKICYAPYDFITVNEDFNFDTNARYHFIPINLIHSLGYYDDSVKDFILIDKKNWLNKLVKVPNTRFATKIKHKDSGKFTIMYCPRWADIKDVIEKCKLTDTLYEPMYDNIPKNISKFTKNTNVTSFAYMIPILLDLSNKHKDWNIIIRPHPTFYLDNPEVYNFIKAIFELNTNVIFDETYDYNYAKLADVFLSDMSSILIDYCRFNKPIFMVSGYDNMANKIKHISYDINIFTNNIDFDKLLESIKNNTFDDTLKSKREKVISEYSMNESQNKIIETFLKRITKNDKW